MERVIEILEEELDDNKRRINKVQNNKNLYTKLNNIIYLLNTSKKDFVEEYKKNEEVRKVIKELVPIDELESIEKEINNLYFLIQSGMYNKEEIKVQKEQSLNTLNALEQLLVEIAEQIDISDVVDIEDDLVNLIGLLKNKKQITDFDSIQKIIDNSNIKDKINLVKSLLLYNTTIYEQELKNKNKKSFTIEGIVLESIKIYLEDPDNLQKVLEIASRKTGANLTTIHEFKDTPEEVIDDLTKEIVALSQEGLSVEDSFKEYFVNNDPEYHESLLIEEDLFLDDESVEETTEISEVKRQIELGYKYVEEHKDLVGTLDEEEKDSVDNYIRSLYKNKENRVTIYQRKKSDLDKEATYEIKLILDMLENLESFDKLDEQTLRKASKRISEILESLQEVKKYQSERLTQGNLIYLMNNKTNKSFFEENLNLEDNKKGINSYYYKEINEALQSLENRGVVSTNSRKVGTYFTKNLELTGVRVLLGENIRIYYIPVGNNDTLLLGVRVKDSNDNFLKELDEIVAKNIVQIETILERINSSKKDELIRDSRLKTNVIRLLLEDDAESLAEIVDNNIPEDIEILDEPQTKK